MRSYRKLLKEKITRDGEILDPQVNFFVLALEKLGCTTSFSCGGHPKGFYIVFSCDYETALRINDAGYCSVEILSSGLWAIRLNESGFESNAGKFTDGDRDCWLESMSKSWVENLL